MSTPDAQHRSIPSVDRVLRLLPSSPLPRAVVVDVVRAKLAAERDRISIGAAAPLDAKSLVVGISDQLDRIARSRLTPVINATGVVLHTNLARSPLAPEAVAAVTAAAGQYTNLEFDLDTGERGSRGAYLERLLATLCEAPAATVVNNCAAALVLILKSLTTTERDEVIISRGELVQIGGGFRIPEILEASHATLREVGTTNRTTADDYRQAITPRSAMLLKIHRGNFYMDGFVESPTMIELAAVAKDAGVPLVFDVGSGAVMPAVPSATEAEPSPTGAIADGADLVCFSGDKLLGGPQAGIIAGDRQLVAKLKRDPFFRALRCDKLVFAALEATVELHLRKQQDQLPIAAMLSAPIDSLQLRAEALAELLDGFDPIRVATDSAVGGGTMPRTRVPSIALSLRHPTLDAGAFAAALRQGSPAVVAVVNENRVRLDLRTVFVSQDQALAAAVLATRR